MRLVPRYTYWRKASKRLRTPRFDVTMTVRDGTVIIMPVNEDAEPITVPLSEAGAFFQRELEELAKL